MDAVKPISSFLDPKMRKLISNAVIKSCFSYGLVKWTFSFGKFNKLINITYQKCLKTVYDDMIIWEAHLKRFYNLARMSVFTIRISKSQLQKCRKY